MKDFVGQTISAGDRVVHGKTGRYGGLNGPYFVIGFTPAMVRLAKKPGEGQWKAALPGNLVVVPQD